MTTETRNLSGVQVWLAWLDGVEPEAWPVLYAQMSEERQARCRRYRREEDRRRCVLSDALARQALADGTPLAPGELTFDREPGGKPFVLGLDRHFSLSHSGNMALCAVAGFPVGADIQRQRPVSDALTRRVASAGYGGHTQADFFAWWVRQEAAGKLAGTGLSLAPLPEGLDFRSGRLTQADGQYFYSVCVKKGLFTEENL